MNRWTLGFVFNTDFSQVLLIHKEHPVHQKGKWNGLGGKYEQGESAQECIAREIEEESALKIDPQHWRSVGRVYGEDWEMDVLSAVYDSDISDAQTMTDEAVKWFSPDDLPKTKRNLRWLIPLCIDALKHNEIAQIDVKYTAVEQWR